MHEYPLDVARAVDFAAWFSAPFLVLDGIMEAVTPGPPVEASPPTPSHLEKYDSWLN